jgi:uncharacterized membrane-anchored protein YhcB (DUF1043 family)
MEDFDSVWQVFSLSLVAGTLIGALGYRWFNPTSKQLDQIKSERDSVNSELEAYKAGVGQYFDKTSQLVNDLTQNYVKVYQHLAEGAQTLGAGKSFNNLLEQNHGKVSLAVEEKSVVPKVIPEDVIIDTKAEQPVAIETPADFSKPVIEETTESSPDIATPEDPQADDTKPEPVPEKSADEMAEAPGETLEISKKG